MRSQSYDVDLLLILCPVCSLFTISHDCVMSLNSLPHCYTIISLPFILAFTTRFSHWLRTLSPSRVPLSHYELLISSTSFATSRYHFPDPALVIDSSFRYLSHLSLNSALLRLITASSVGTVPLFHYRLSSPCGNGPPAVFPFSDSIALPLRFVHVGCVMPARY